VGRCRAAACMRRRASCCATPIPCRRWPTRSCARSSGCRRPAPATSCAPCPRAPCRVTGRSTCRRWTRCARRFRPTA
jgi:hypothetical protein